MFVGTRFSDGDGSSNEVQRTMLELINQLDGFDPRGNIKILMATNRYVAALLHEGNPVVTYADIVQYAVVMKTSCNFVFIVCSLSLSSLCSLYLSKT